MIMKCFFILIIIICFFERLEFNCFGIIIVLIVFFMLVLDIIFDSFDVLMLVGWILFLKFLIIFLRFIELFVWFEIIIVV